MVSFPHKWDLQMEKNRKWYKISEIERLSGVSRRTIHFYLQNELLHTPFKTGKTMSYYDDNHLIRLALIKQLKTEGLPLFLIKEEIEKQMKDPSCVNEQRTALSSEADRKSTRLNSSHVALSRMPSSA